MQKKSDHSVVLAARGVSKRFGGIKALDQVNLDIRAGEVHALVGENGAGKSTLMKILAGIHVHFEGTLTLEGQPLTLTHPSQALALGIAMIHQELNLIPYLSIAENIFLGRELRHPLGWIDGARMRDQTRRLLESLDLQVSPDTPVCELRVGQQQQVEIAKALSLQARVIIMDEPTSAISDREVTILFERIRALKEQGVAIVYISHKMEEILAISDRITVLRDGCMVATRQAAEVTQEALVSLMVGRDLAARVARTGAVGADVILRVEDLSLAHPTRRGDFLVDHVTLQVCRGEVVGLFGLMGAGRSELLETLFGLHPRRSSGRMAMEGKQVPIHSARAAIQAGLALVPEDRKQQGLVLGMSVRHSISLASIRQVESFGFLSPRREQALACDYIGRLNIKTPSDRQAVQNLSGGNQQKVVLAKWLATRPRVLLLDEPTRGIDIHAKSEIYRLIGELAQSGMAILMVSSELPEIMALSDRILVLSEGCLTAEMTRSEATEERLLQAALPGQRHRRR
jgi:ribose transport system ATP-binding protein